MSMAKELHMIENDDNTISVTIVIEDETMQFIMPGSFDQMLAEISGQVCGEELYQGVGENMILIPNGVENA